MPEIKNLTECLLIKYSVFFVKYYVLSMPCESTILVVWCVSPAIIFLDVEIK